MKKILLALAVVATIAAPVAQAQQNLGVSIQGGTTGLSLHLIKPISDNLNVRVGFNGMSTSFDESTTDANYDLDVKLRTFDALLDYYPMHGTFRVTAGAAYNGSKLNARGTPRANGTYTFNGNVYTVASTGSINGEMEFNKLAPYLGIGWGNAVAKDKGWGFTADLGVLFTGSPDTTLTSSGCTSGTEICNRLATDLARESARLNDESKDFKYFPVIRLGATYKF